MNSQHEDQLDGQLDKRVVEDVRSAFDEMFGEVGIGVDGTSAPPSLDNSVGVGRLTPKPSRLPLTRAAASVAVLAVGVLLAVAVRSSRSSAPLGGVPISTVEISESSSTPSQSSPATSTVAASEQTAATSTNVDERRSLPPSTAVVFVKSTSDSYKLLVYDVATGTVIDRIDPWGSQRTVWGVAHYPSGSDRAYFVQQIVNIRDICEFTTGKILSVPWPDPPVGPDGVPEFDVVTDYGGRILQFSPDGRTLIYDAHPGCVNDRDGRREPGFHDALRLRDLDTGAELTVTTRLGADDPAYGGIISAVMTPDGELVVMMGPTGDVYRLAPTDGAIIEESGVLVANVGHWSLTDRGLPWLLSADASSITVNATMSLITDQTPDGPNQSTVWRGPNADGTWTELVDLIGEGSVDADSEGNLIVAAEPDAVVTTDPGESIPILRTTEPGQVFVRW